MVCEYLIYLLQCPLWIVSGCQGYRSGVQRYSLSAASSKDPPLPSPQRDSKRTVTETIGLAFSQPWALDRAAWDGHRYVEMHWSRRYQRSLVFVWEMFVLKFYVTYVNWSLAGIYLDPGSKAWVDFQEHLQGSYLPMCRTWTCLGQWSEHIEPDLNRYWTHFVYRTDDFVATHSGIRYLKIITTVYMIFGHLMIFLRETHVSKYWIVVWENHEMLLPYWVVLNGFKLVQRVPDYTGTESKHVWLLLILDAPRLLFGPKMAQGGRVASEVLELRRFGAS